MKTNQRPLLLRKAFAANLRREREALGLSQKALAHEAGMVERGECNISIDKVERLARALGLEPAELMMWRRSNRAQTR